MNVIYFIINYIGTGHEWTMSGQCPVLSTHLTKDGKMSKEYTVLIMGQDACCQYLDHNFQKINELFSGREFKDRYNTPFIFDKGKLEVLTANVNSNFFLWHGCFRGFCPDIFLTRVQHLDWSCMYFLEVTITLEEPCKVGKWIYDPSGHFIARDDDFNGWHEIITNGWNRIDINYMQEVTQMIYLKPGTYKPGDASKVFEEFSSECKFKNSKFSSGPRYKFWKVHKISCCHSENKYHKCHILKCPLKKELGAKL